MAGECRSGYQHVRKIGDLNEATGFTAGFAFLPDCREWADHACAAVAALRSPLPRESEQPASDLHQKRNVRDVHPDDELFNDWHVTVQRDTGGGSDGVSRIGRLRWKGERSR